MSDFDRLIQDIEDEARAEGLDAVAELAAFDGKRCDPTPRPALAAQRRRFTAGEPGRQPISPRTFVTSWRMRVSGSP